MTTPENAALSEREELARIIDPLAWEVWDEVKSPHFGSYGLTGEPEGRVEDPTCARWLHKERTHPSCTKSLAKADAILARRAPPVAMAEPVAWRVSDWRGGWAYYDDKARAEDEAPVISDGPVQPLYTAPPAPQPTQQGGDVLANALEMTGCRDEADLIDMANVGKSLLDRIAEATAGGPFKGWAPADDPSEIVTDLLNQLEDALSDYGNAEGEAKDWELRSLEAETALTQASKDGEA